MKKKTIFSDAIVPLCMMCVVICLGACNKLVTVTPPVGIQTTRAVFSSDQGATAALTAIYSQMMSVNNYSFASGGLTLYPGLSADELVNTNPNANYSAFYSNALLPTATSDLDNQLWRPAYAFIYQANAVLEGLKAGTGISAAIKDNLEGEAKFVRAFCYLYLESLFGPVPLVTSTDYHLNNTLPRSGQVDSLVYQDLNDAIHLLPENYASAGRARPNKWAAVALKARLDLYQEKWADAEAGATAVIASGIYGLEPDLDKVFPATSREAIWQLMPVITDYGNNTLEGLLFVPYDSYTIPEFTIHPALLGAFETGDRRRTSWIGKNTIDGKDYYYPFKYKIADNSPAAPLEYSMVLRLAEVCLIRAEARAHLDNIAGAQADLDSVRIRAGLAPTTAADPAALLTAIQQERRIELAFEWGHRWLDLKRAHSLDAVLGTEKPDWQSDDGLYPIPGQEIRSNPFLSQNPGYPNE